MIFFHSNSSILGILYFQTNLESGSPGQISTMLLPTKHRPSLNVVASLMSVSRHHVLQNQCRTVSAFIGFPLICVKRLLAHSQKLRTKSDLTTIPLPPLMKIEAWFGLTVWVKLLNRIQNLEAYQAYQASFEEILLTCRRSSSRGKDPNIHSPRRGILYDSVAIDAVIFSQLQTECCTTHVY
jgi:hypothetical protein